MNEIINGERKKKRGDVEEFTLFEYTNNIAPMTTIVAYNCSVLTSHYTVGLSSEFSNEYKRSVAITSK